MANGAKKKVVNVKAQKCADYAVIDYPQENETVNRPSYTIRIGTSGGGHSVEISINGSDWAPCYHAAGYWWFSWANYSSGLHKIVARMRDNKGKTLAESTIRKCICKA